MHIDQYLSLLGMQHTYDVHARHSVVDLFPVKSRCGLYILHFSDGMYYVGQAVDVARRFAQHKKNHADIIGISFKQVHRSKLDNAEKEAIFHLDGPFSLRNISLAAQPYITSAELDDLIAPEAQAAWLDSHNAAIQVFTRAEDERLRLKTRNRCNRLLENPIFTEDILPVMRRYIALCLPEPYLTEISFWGCSCLPQYNSDPSIFSRINLRFQEVFTMGFDKGCRLPVYNWHVAQSPMDSSYLTHLHKRIKTFRNSNHAYKTGGRDQINLHVSTREDALQLLDDPEFIKAAKVFNLRCMRKGAQPYASSHCPALADYILPARAC